MPGCRCAGEPDTSEIPTLPNSSVYAPVRNPRARWRSDALELPTPQSVFPVVSSQNVPAATSPWPTPMSVIHETPPVTPHIDTQPETPLPTPSTDDEPMSLHHDDDTPPWVYQEPETQWIPIEADTPAIIPQQVPSPPMQVSPSRESNMSTGDPIIPPPPWFDETPPPPSTTHEDILPPAPSFDETTPLKAAQVPETPTIPSVAKRWRSGTLHLENPVSKRWRSDTLHPETPVPATTPPQLRWRAGVLRALRPFRRLRDKQSDPSDARVKRPRLAPAQVMSTALEKGCDWSLGFDGRGPCSMKSTRIGATRFFSQDVRQEKRFILLQSLQRISVCCLGHTCTIWENTVVPVSARRSLQVHMLCMTSEGEDWVSARRTREKKLSDCWFLRKDESYKRPPSCVSLASFTVWIPGSVNNTFCPRNSIGHA